MTPRRFAALAVAALTAAPPDAAAGWDNVFQVTCRRCRNRISYSEYAAPAPVVAAPPAVSFAPPADPCPPTRSSMRVEYQQRSFYEPITVMKPERYLEPVEVRSRSYYYEPVTSYTYSSFYDPCTCRCEQVATPRTSYRLREQCNTSLRYVERTRMVPTQSRRLVTESVPVYTYSGPPVRTYSAPEAVDPCPPGSPAPAAPAPALQVDEFRRTPPTAEPDPDANIPPQNLPGRTGSAPRAMPPMSAPRRSPARVDAHTTARGSGAAHGEVVLADRRTPRPGARLVFLNADDLADRKYATADAFGQFDVVLPAGEWHVYVGGGDGRAAYQQKLAVSAGPPAAVQLVSR